MSNPLLLADHPRLYVPFDPIEESPSPRRAALLAAVEAEADTYVDQPDFDELSSTHNAHLIRARTMQTRVATLLAQWLATRERRYRDSVVAHVETMGRWEYWSWIAWRREDARPEAIFDLSYGENSATIALAYDLLYADLEESERTTFTDIALRRSFRPFLTVLEEERTTWYQRADSNWNTVCAGGAGMLALAFHDDLAEARSVLPFVESSIEPYMSSLAKTSGGWPEGIGYWNYGMRYAFMYLLSYERATRRRHPLLRADATRATLSFPLDFCPSGQGCSFGDSNHWSPLPIHAAVARALDAPEVLRDLRSLEGETFGIADGPWPRIAEALLLDRVDDAGSASSVPAAKAEPQVASYPGLGWVRIADQWPRPNFYVSIRGGTTEVPHGHIDLLSFHTVVGNERLIENLTPAEYLDTTFGPRRYELFEMTPASKNVPLINGVGIVKGSAVEPEVVEWDGNVGVRLDATEAMGEGRAGEQLARSAVRLFVYLAQGAALVLDSVDLWQNGRVEARVHTRADVDISGVSARLTGQRERMGLAFAADLPFTLSHTSTTPTTPGDEATVIRWCGPRELDRRALMGMLLVPGERPCELTMTRSERGIDVEARIGDRDHSLAFGPCLEVPASG